MVTLVGRYNVASCRQSVITCLFNLQNPSSTGVSPSTTLTGRRAWATPSLHQTKMLRLLSLFCSFAPGRSLRSLAEVDPICGIGDEER